jgi:hypothetical protein
MLPAGWLALTVETFSLACKTRLPTGPLCWVADWDALYREHPKDVIRSAEHGRGVLTGGFFASAENGTIYKQIELITFNQNSTTPVRAQTGYMECWPCMQQPGAQICAGGLTEIAAEFCSETSVLAQREGLKQWTISDSLLHRIDKPALLPIRIVDLTIAYDPKGVVGGKIDAIELRKDGGIRWLQRKDNCPENQD